MGKSVGSNDSMYAYKLCINLIYKVLTYFETLFFYLIDLSVKQ